MITPDDHNSFCLLLSAQRKFLSILGSQIPVQLKDSCHALEILFRSNEDYFIIMQAELNVKKLHIVLGKSWLPGY